MVDFVSAPEALPSATDESLVSVVLTVNLLAVDSSNSSSEVGVAVELDSSTRLELFLKVFCSSRCSVVVVVDLEVILGRLVSLTLAEPDDDVWDEIVPSSDRVADVVDSQLPAASDFRVVEEDPL